MTKLKSILSHYPNYLLVIALVLSSIAISIRGGDGEVRLVLNDYPALITLLVTISVFLVALYFIINKNKMVSLSDQIRALSKEEASTALLNDLTDRQKEVYELIIMGKSNKEIMSELFIEQSTLKTHINQIYRKLNIKSRRELRFKSS